MLKKQLEELQPGSPVVIKERKSTIERVAESMSGNYVIQRLKTKQCVVTLIEGFTSARAELFDTLDFSNPFEVIEYESASVEYVRVLVNTYNKENNRSFKVSKKGDTIKITEPFELIDSIDPMKVEAWRESFDRELKKKIS